MAATSETILIHSESGESTPAEVPMIVLKERHMQEYGSAVTYARRYGLMAMAGIAPEDDDGAAAKAPRSRSSASGETDAEAIRRRLEYLSGADSLDDLKERWGRIEAVAASAEVIAAKDAARSAWQASRQVPRLTRRGFYPHAH